MTRNRILDDLHAARQEILAECEGDTASYLRDAEKRLRESGRPIAKVKQRTIRCTEAAKSAAPKMKNPSSPLGDR